MHNFNPPNKYSLRTRMGNWSEEWDLEEAKYFLNHSDAKNTSGKRTKESPKSIRKNSFSPKVIKVYLQLDSGISHLFQRWIPQVRRSCDALQWKSLRIFRYTQFELVTDIFDITSTTEQSYNVSAVKNIHAAARSVFIL